MTATPFDQFPEVILLRFPIHSDERGSFAELFRLASPEEFVQDNLSISKKGVIRGMHFQSDPGQAKLVTCLIGEIFDVFVDVRKESPSFGKWGSYRLKGSSGEQLLIPVGFAHGFASISDSVVLYKVSSFYDPATEKGFCYNDSRVGVEWPVSEPILSERDRKAKCLQEVMEGENLDLGSGRATR